MDSKKHSLPSRFSSEEITLFCVVCILLGAFFRVLYVGGTVAWFSPHDMGELIGQANDGCGSGHLGYMEYLLKYRALADFSPVERWGFYNPPFFYVCAAALWQLLLWMHFPYVEALEGVQLLPFVCILLAVIGCYKILRLLKIDGVPLILATIFLSGHPTLSYLSCTLNNDGMSLAFAVWAIFFTLKWYKEPCWKWILPAGVCIGLGMMTKISTAIVAPGMAFLFAVRFFRGKKRWLSFLAQFAGFAGISFPLGLFWPVRNLVRFGLPLNYVQALPENSVQNVEAFSLWQRVGIFSPAELLRTWTSFSSQSELGHPDYNVWIQLLRSSVVDDNILRIPEGFFQHLTAGLLILSALFAMGGTAVVLVLLAKGKKDWVGPVWLTINCAVTLWSYVSFSLEYPVTCSMHFRYVAVFLLYGLVAWGTWWRQSSDCRRDRWLRRISGGGMVVYALGATLLYLACL